VNILVLGGYGNFGARICRALAREHSARVIVAGRDGSRARTLAEQLPSGGSFARIDIRSDRLAQTLRSLHVNLVIHTAGPFHGQGYGVAEAAAQAGAHYIDLADGRRFVCDFPAAMGNLFSVANRCAVTGASSLPGLSSAVVAHLCRTWKQIEAIEVCIAPAQAAARGEATLAGVLSYCGEPFQIWRQGAWQTARGWSELKEVEFARMPSRLGALCDVPDLELFPEHFQVSGDVEFRAAIEVRLVQRGFAVLSALRAQGLIPRPARFASVLNDVGAFFDRFGSLLGGMVVRAKGTDGTGRPVQRSWHIAADYGHGPEIPCMPAILLARKLLAGELPSSGAFTAAGLLQLSEFEPEFKRWGMRTTLLEEQPDVAHRHETSQA
jgi:saccharopine dehydrogenase-like NADP-dependent oxidoreductase